mgnify:FL=1
MLGTRNPASPDFVVVRRQGPESPLHGLDAEGHVDTCLTQATVDSLGRTRHTRTELGLDEPDQGRHLAGDVRSRIEATDRRQRTVTTVGTDRNRCELLPAPRRHVRLAIRDIAQAAPTGVVAADAPNEEVNTNDKGTEHQINDCVVHCVLLV